MNKYFYSQLITVALILLAGSTLKAQEPVSDEQTITVQTEVTQIAVSLNGKNKTNPRWELFSNKFQIGEYALDTPENAPLRSVILILQTEKNSRDFRTRSSKINKNGNNRKRVDFKNSPICFHLACR